MQDAERIVRHSAQHAVEPGEYGKRHGKWIPRILSNYFLCDAGKRTQSAPRASGTIDRCGFPCTHKYDSDMEILLNTGEKLLRIPFIKIPRQSLALQ
jgi:hypothetical protein